VRALIGERVKTLLRRRRQARLRGAPDAIHDVRVATRRLQEALKVFAHALPARERERLRRRARSIRRSLAALRDADVLLDLVRRLRAEPGGRAAPGLAALERRLAVRAGRLRRRLGRHHGPAGVSGPGLRIRGVRKRASALLHAAGEPANGLMSRAAVRVIGARARAVRAALRPARSGRAAALHRLRVAIKRYRYCLETLEAWGMTSLEPGIGQARDLQEKLGAIHELDVLIELVRGTHAIPVLGRLRAERRRLAAAAGASIRAFRPLAPRAAAGSGPAPRVLFGERAT